MTALLSEATESEDSDVVGDVDIGEGARQASTSWTRNKARRDSRGRWDIDWGSTGESLSSAWVLRPLLERQRGGSHDGIG